MNSQIHTKKYLPIINKFSFNMYFTPQTPKPNGSKINEIGTYVLIGFMKMYILYRFGLFVCIATNLSSPHRPWLKYCFQPAYTKYIITLLHFFTYNSRPENKLYTWRVCVYLLVLVRVYDRLHLWYSVTSGL